MYRLRLTLVPENGTLEESGLRVPLQDLGLGAPFDGDGVDLDFELTRMMEKVYGRVRAEAGVHLTCGRCLKDFQARVTADFKVLFEERPEAGGEELDPDDPGPTAAFYEGEELPLGEEVRQELELRLPFAPLCEPDCKGRCATCGQDLNEKDCGHGGHSGSSAFAALKDLYNKKQGT